MNKKEVFELIRRNRHSRQTAIRLISDFLVISMQEARKIYDNEFVSDYLPEKKNRHRVNFKNEKNITFDGSTHTVKEWAQIKGINLTTLRNRLYNYGWSIERALTEPTRIFHRRKGYGN